MHRDVADLAPLIRALLPSGCALVVVVVVVVVDHFGRLRPRLGKDDPEFSALLRTAESGRVWVKLSAAYRHSTEAALPASQRNAASTHQDAGQARLTASALLDAFGPDRLVWVATGRTPGIRTWLTLPAVVRCLMTGYLLRYNAAAYWWTHQLRFFAFARS